MNAKRGQRKRVGDWVLRGALAFFLVLALLAPALGAKERRGAGVIIFKKDGKVIGGELLAVRGTEVILLDELTNAEARESLVNIQSIDKVLKKSNWLPGMIIGALAGAAIGAAVGPKSGGNQTSGTDDLVTSKGQTAVLGAVGYGLLGAVVGGLIKDKPVKIERTDPEYLAGVAAKLKKWARDPS